MTVLTFPENDSTKREKIRKKNYCGCQVAWDSEVKLDHGSNLANCFFFIFILNSQWIFSMIYENTTVNLVILYCGQNK